MGNAAGNAVGNSVGHVGNAAGNIVGNGWGNDAVFSLNMWLRTIYCLQTLHEPACVILTLFQFLKEVVKIILLILTSQNLFKNLHFLLYIQHKYISQILPLSQSIIFKCN